MKWRTCLQDGAPACPYLYEEWWYVPVPVYVDISAVEGTMVLQEKERRLVRYDHRLHIGLAGCLRGLGHERGHLIDARHGRVSVWEEEDDDGD